MKKKQIFKDDHSEHAIALGRSINDIAADLGLSHNTVHRWGANAKRRGFPPPPLHDYKLLPDWLETVFPGRAVPPGVLLAAGKVRPMQAHADEVDSVLPPAEPDALDGKGIDQTLDRLRREERSLHRLYERAKKNGDPGLPQLLQTWLNATEALRKLEKDASRMLVDQGELVSRAAVEALLADMHKPLLQQMRAMYQKFCEIDSISPTADGEGIWNKEVDKMCLRLQGGAWNQNG